MKTPQELADELIGTAGMGIVVDEELATQADVESFDELAFCCEVCGWWCSTDELNNEGMLNECDDCHKEHEDGDS